MTQAELPANGEQYPGINRHLRLTLETDGKRLNLLRARVVNEPVLARPFVVGPVAYQVTFGGRAAWVETLPDPLLVRGAARPGEQEHFFATEESGIFVARIPLPSNELPPDFEVRFFRIAAEPPETVAALAQRLRARAPEGFDVLGTIDLPALMSHPDWQRIATEGALAVRR